MFLIERLRSPSSAHPNYTPNEFGSVLSCPTVFLPLLCSTSRIRRQCSAVSIKENLHSTPCPHVELDKVFEVHCQISTSKTLQLLSLQFTSRPANLQRLLNHKPHHISFKLPQHQTYTQSQHRIKTTMAPKELNFITGNKNKLAEVQAILSATPVKLQSQAIDLLEIQGTIEEISRDKAIRAADAVWHIIMMIHIKKDVINSEHL